MIIVVGIGIYFFGQAPKIFQGTPKEKILPSTQKFISTPTPTFSTAPQTPPQAPTIPDYLIPSGFTRDQLSSYFQKIRISSAYASSYGGYPSEIKLYSYLSNDEKVDITGWRIKAYRGEIIIPQAVNIYEPAGLAPQEDIVLSANNYVSIYSTNSPISRNFRLNKCTGYLENIYDFNPALPQNCPSVSRSEISYLSGGCQSYILSLSACSVPNSSFYNLLPGNVEGNTCRLFLDTISPNSCFQKHRSDSDFLSNEWRVWTGQNILDLQHDTVQLFDKQGLLVDEYIY